MINAAYATDLIRTKCNAFSILERNIYDASLNGYNEIKISQLTNPEKTNSFNIMGSYLCYDEALSLLKKEGYQVKLKRKWCPMRYELTITWKKP